MNRKLDSIWWHETPENGPLASAHIAVLFCALVSNGMIVKDLLDFKFQDIPEDFSDRSLSPMDYCLAYTDGELFDDYIKAKYRESIVDLFDSDKIYYRIADEHFMEHSKRGSSGYTLECTWHNVDILADWLERYL